MASNQEKADKAFLEEGIEIDPSSAKKLTDWENEPTVLNLKEDFLASKPTHDTIVRKIEEWTDLLHTTGKARPKPMKGRSSVQPKLVRKQAEWRYPALSEPFLSSEEMFDVEPVTGSSAEGARQNKAVINWQFRTKLDKVSFIDEYVRAAVDEGTAIVQIGWERETKIEQQEQIVWHFLEPELGDEKYLALFTQSFELMNSDPAAYEELPESMKAAVNFFMETKTIMIAEDSGQRQMVDVEVVLKNQPTVTVINPRNFYFDPSCNGDFSKANFALVSFETSKADLLKAGDRYKNLEYVNWESALPLISEDHSSSLPADFNFADQLRKRVVAYEYWGFYDIHGTGELVPIVATWIGDTIIRMEENPFPDQKLPFEIVTYMPRKRELMGEPDAELLSDNQAILGATYRGIIDLLGRSANSQQGIAKGALDALNRKRFDNGQDYEYNPNMHPSNAIFMHQYPEIGSGPMNLLLMQNQEAESLTGVKAFSGGISGEAYGDVAAGIRGVLDAASKREMSILRRLAAGIRRIGERIVSMNQAFLSEEEVVRLTNREFITVKREDLAGEYDLIVDISTAEIDAEKAQKLGFLLQTIGPSADFSLTKMILVQIARLNKMVELADALEVFEPAPDPAAERMKELELMEKEAQVAKLQAEANKINAEAELAMQRANAVNLDVVETETGTKHERDMAKQRGQSQGNQNLKITEALLNGAKEGETPPDIDAAVGFNVLSGNESMPFSNTAERDAAAQTNPEANLGSQYYDPSLDPASNLALNL